MQVTLVLPSGRTLSLSVESESSKVGDLKALAQEAVGKGFLRLVTSQGSILTDGTASLTAAGLRDGDEIMAVVVEQVKLAATRFAFALWTSDSVVTWGHPEWGGDSSAVQDQLRNVQKIQATGGAFAAILEDGSVVAWGAPERGYGGNSSAVQDRLRSVQQLQATKFAFAAILEDGSVVTWGVPNFGTG